MAQLTEAISVCKGGAEALNFDAMKFDVETAPLFDKGGIQIPKEIRQGIYNKDTGDIISTCGSKYQPVAHYQIGEKIRDKLIHSEVDLSDIEVTNWLYDDGAKWRMQIVFNKYIAEPQVGDILKLRMLIDSSLDLTRMFSAIFDALRLWCLNGCVSPAIHVANRYKHTFGFNMEAVANKIALAPSKYNESKEEFEKMIKSEVTREEALQFFKKTIGHRPRPTEPNHYSKPLVDNLTNRFEKEAMGLGYTLWALYNTLTHYSSHPEKDEDWGDTRGKLHNVQYNRERQVAKALMNDMWLVLFTDNLDGQRSAYYKY